jgi:uncharacterized membrane protein required for colicin V production
MENMTPFDVVAFLFLVGWFIVGYFQGLMRRLLGVAALVFSLLVAGQARQSLGAYLAGEWQGAPADYGYMVAFGAAFLALWIALSVGIQLAYRPAPLLSRYPVADEIVGGVLGIVEGGLLLMALLMITDPYFASSAGQAAAPGEFGPIRWLHDLLNDSLTAAWLREQLIPGVFAVIGFLFPQDVVNAFR